MSATVRSPAHIRTVEDLGSEVFVHVAFDHEGETVSAVSKMPAPFKGVTGDTIDVQLAGTVHLFDPGRGADRHRDCSLRGLASRARGARATDRARSPGRPATSGGPRRAASPSRAGHSALVDHPSVRDALDCDAT